MSETEDAPLEQWRQGDFALGVGGFLFAAPSDHDELYDPEEIVDGIVGLIVVSQSCDIVRRDGGRDFVAVCPLVERPSEEIAAIKKGYRPYLVEVEHTAENVFADLRRIMSVSKDFAAKVVPPRGVLLGGETNSFCGGHGT